MIATICLIILTKIKTIIMEYTKEEIETIEAKAFDKGWRTGLFSMFGAVVIILLMLKFVMHIL